LEDEESLERDSLLDMAERVERAMDRMLAVSEPRGAEVGPAVGVDVLTVEAEPPVEVEVRPLGRGESPFKSPFRDGNEGDEDAAEDGESSSGVEDKVLVSVPGSSGWCEALICGVGICDMLGVEGLL
jgi:hypothetical protein